MPRRLDRPAPLRATPSASGTTPGWAVRCGWTTDEALALVVALRTLAHQPGLTDRGAVEWALAKVEAAAGGAVEVASAVARVRRAERTHRAPALAARGAGPEPGAGAPDVLRGRPGPDHRARRRPGPAALGPRPVVPGGLVPVGQVRCGSSGSIGSTPCRSWTSRLCRRPTRSRATCPRASTSRRRALLVNLRLDQPGRWAAEQYPCETATRRPGRSRRPCARPTRPGCAGWCSGSALRPRRWGRPGWSSRYGRAPRRAAYG